MGGHCELHYLVEGMPVAPVSLDMTAGTVPWQFCPQSLYWLKYPSLITNIHFLSWKLVTHHYTQMTELSDA